MNTRKQITFQVSKNYIDSYEKIVAKDVTKYTDLNHFGKCAFIEKVNREVKDDDTTDITNTSI